jgi:hypothetical protein
VTDFERNTLVQGSEKRDTRARMKKDYQFLIGQRFSVGGEIYVVQDLTDRDEQTYVRAAASTDDIVLSEPGTSDRLFSLNEVIQSLLVDEEIELFSPNYLAAR